MFAPAFSSEQFAALPAPAQFQLFDNFNSYANGQLVGQGGWNGTVNPTSTQVLNGEAALGNFATASPTYRALDGMSILNSSSAATVFLQFNLASVATPPASGNNLNFVITDVAAPPDTAGPAKCSSTWIPRNRISGLAMARDL